LLKYSIILKNGVMLQSQFEFFRILIFEEDKSIRSSLYFVVLKPNGWKINNDSCLENMRKKELEGRQMGQCSTNLITCHKTFHFEKKSYAKLMLGQKDFTVFRFTKFVGSCKS
jgi:hypothetical protein